MNLLVFFFILLIHVRFKDCSKRRSNIIIVGIILK